MRVFMLVVLALLVGAGIYFYTPDIPHAKLVERYGGAPSQFIQMPDGTTAHYRDQGNSEGLPIVLLHGTPSNLYTWEGWVAPLGGKYRIITVDLPGHGLTGRTPGDNYTFDALETFVDNFANALHLEQFVLGGNSLGGELATRYALHVPARVKALILVDAGGVTVPDLKQELPLGLKIARIPVLRYGLLWFTPKGLVAQGYKNSYGDPTKVTDEQVDRNWRLIRHQGNRTALLKRYALPTYAPLNDRLARISVPTLVMWGKLDKLEPLAIGEAYAAGILGSQTAYFDGVGHVPQEEAAEASAGAVLSFLERFDSSIPQAPELSSGNGG